ncbi:MAG: NADH-quinone oxidoreductase subunit C, partial [Candidatus Hydrothermarchaeota archaeon]|nr:NADH-quinone oxidoreductase subunit C [Candidatus Hydrothermarchaeota archaeon]
RLWAAVKKEALLEVCRYLKENQGFEHLSSVSGVDYADRFEVVYHLWSYSKKKLLSLKVPLPKHDPTLGSITSIWKAANWHERETYDMFGIIFKGHPNLTRILLPEDFEGYPFRKDYELKENPWFSGKSGEER